MHKIFFTLMTLLLLTGCYEATQEVITKEEAVDVSLLKTLKFEGRGLTKGGKFDEEPDVYHIVGAQRPHDYIYVKKGDPAGVKNTIRFLPLPKNLFLAQIHPEGSGRYQLLLLRKNGTTFEVLMPKRFDNGGINIQASQKEFARQLGIKFSGTGYGPFQLSGDPKKIQRFMHSLSTLPIRVVYKFNPI